MRESAIEAYPLHWPMGRKRTQHREASRFRLGFAKVRDQVMRELNLLGAKQIVMSTNIPTKANGLPYAQQSQPQDPAVAVYFTYKNKQMCFACDRWNRVEDNMSAVANTVGALRGIARWGTGDMLEAAFTGFAALPNPESSKHWSDVLFIDPDSSREEIDAAYKRLRSQTHPDKGGDADTFNEVKQAYEQAISND